MPVSSDMIAPDAIGDARTIAGVQGFVSEAIPFPSTAPKFTLVESTVEDFDRLWDWARSDKEAVASFLDRAHTNSQSFFQQIGKILGEEREQRAWFRSIRRGDELCGFVMLAPILKTQTTLAATLHLYVASHAVGAEGTAAIPENVIAQLPPDMTLAMVAPTEEFAQMFTPLGFESKIVLTRPASAVTGHE